MAMLYRVFVCLSAWRASESGSHGGQQQRAGRRRRGSGKSHQILSSLIL